MTLTRRTVLRNGGAALASLGAASQVAIAAENPPSQRNTLTPGGATDQNFDQWENVNEAESPGRSAVKAQLHAQLRQHFDRFAVPYTQSS